MTPTIWLMILIAALVIEFIKIELYGACAACGALAGFVACLFDAPVLWQIGLAVMLAGFLLVVVRPVGMKYVMSARREKERMQLEGCDAIVTNKIDNAAGTGVVMIGGRSWSARSNRPNAVINEGEVVKVVKMRGDFAYVDIKRKDRRYEP